MESLLRIHIGNRGSVQGKRLALLLNLCRSPNWMLRCTILQQSSSSQEHPSTIHTVERCRGTYLVKPSRHAPTYGCGDNLPGSSRQPLNSRLLLQHFYATTHAKKLGGKKYMVVFARNTSRAFYVPKVV